MVIELHDHVSEGFANACRRTNRCVNWSICPVILVNLASWHEGFIFHIRRIKGLMLSEVRCKAFEIPTFIAQGGPTVVVLF